MPGIDKALLPYIRNWSNQQSDCNWIGNLSAWEVDTIVVCIPEIGILSLMYTGFQEQFRIYMLK